MGTHTGGHTTWSASISAAASIVAALAARATASIWAAAALVLTALVATTSSLSQPERGLRLAVSVTSRSLTIVEMRGRGARLEWVDARIRMLVLRDALHLVHVDSVLRAKSTG